jgi:hypothetical protein
LVAALPCLSHDQQMAVILLCGSSIRTLATEQGAKIGALLSVNSSFAREGVENFQILRCVFDPALQRNLGALLSGRRLFVGPAR